MKRFAYIGLVLALAAAAWAQSDKPAAQSTSGQSATPPTTGKRPPQAKTQPEFEAYKAAIASPDAASIEKAADDFAAKYPDSELRVMLYKAAMQAYQKTGNSEKIVAVGRKALAIDPDDPEALVNVASEIAEKTRDTDLDKDSEAAQQFRRALIRIWKQTATFEAARNMSNTSVSAARSSLAARTRKAAHLIGEKNKPRASGKFTSGKWQAVQKAFDAYWRFDGDAEGNSFLRLAIKFEITFQIGVQVPGAVDQRSLNRLAKQYGLATTDEDVKDRLTGGGRLLVFSDDLTEEILQTPEEFYEEDHERAFD